MDNQISEKLRQLQDRRSKFISDHNSRMREIDAAIAAAKQTTSLDHSETDKKLEETKKSLDDLLRYFNHENCGIFSNISFIK